VHVARADLQHLGVSLTTPTSCSLNLGHDRHLRRRRTGQSAPRGRGLESCMALRGLTPRRGEALPLSEAFLARAICSSDSTARPAMTPGSPADIAVGDLTVTRLAHRHAVLGGWLADAGHTGNPTNDVELDARGAGTDHDVNIADLGLFDAGDPEAEARELTADGTDFGTLRERDDHFTSSGSRRRGQRSRALW
jgi:hypothetical protein